MTQTSGPVSGAFSIGGFSAEGQTLVASGVVAISLCFPGVDPKNCLASYGFATTVEVTAISGTCDAITLEFAPIQGFVGDRFEIEAQAVTPLVSEESQRRLQCTIARQAETAKPLFTFAPLLNRL